MTVQRRNPDDLATWQLRDYRKELEQAIALLPATAPVRQVCAGYLCEAVSEQEARSKVTGLPEPGNPRLRPS
jgi:hypothetical protein